MSGSGGGEKSLGNLNNDDCNHNPVVENGATITPSQSAVLLNNDPIMVNSFGKCQWVSGRPLTTIQFG